MHFRKEIAYRFIYNMNKNAFFTALGKRERHYFYQKFTVCAFLVLAFFLWSFLTYFELLLSLVTLHENWAFVNKLNLLEKKMWAQ